MFLIYSKDNCVYCESAKQLLKNKNLDYNEIKIGRDISTEDFKEKFPEFRTVPQIWDGETYIGGFDQLSKYFK